MGTTAAASAGHSQVSEMKDLVGTLSSFMFCFAISPHKVTTVAFYSWVVALANFELFLGRGWAISCGTGVHAWCHATCSDPGRRSKLSFSRPLLPLLTLERCCAREPAPRKAGDGPWCAPRISPGPCRPRLGEWQRGEVRRAPEPASLASSPFGLARVAG